MNGRSDSLITIYESDKELTKKTLGRAQILELMEANGIPMDQSLHFVRRPFSDEKQPNNRLVFAGSVQATEMLVFHSFYYSEDGHYGYFVYGGGRDWSEEVSTLPGSGSFSFSFSNKEGLEEGLKPLTDLIIGLAN